MVNTATVLYDAISIIIYILDIKRMFISKLKGIVRKIFCISEIPSAGKHPYTLYNKYNKLFFYPAG